MTRSEFIGNPDLCRHLNTILNDTVFLEAIAIAMNEMRPGRPDASQGDIVHQAAMAGQRNEGAHEIFGKIRSLTLPKGGLKSTLPPEYQDEVVKTLITQGYSQEEALEAFKQSNSTQNPT